jgi:hypothetical protein
MKQFIRAVMCMCFFLIAHTAGAEDSTGIKLSYQQLRLNSTEMLLTIKAVTENGAKLYALKKNEADVLYSTVSFDSAHKKYLSGDLKETGPLKAKTIFL